MATKYTSAEQACNFVARAARSTIMRGGCKVWTGGAIPDGYGVLSKDRYGENLAHRAAYRATFGEIPPGAHVLHTCDNPACVLTAHLSLGTHKMNMEDRTRKERTGGVKLTAETVRKIRSDYAQGMTQRSIARAVGVGFKAVSKIVLRQRWVHVEDY